MIQAFAMFTEQGWLTDQVIKRVIICFLLLNPHFFFFSVVYHETKIEYQNASILERDFR